MARRPYTLKEMKLIVDYLVEHRAYSEVRGRKMWMDLASSKIVERTWQSLKETFNKRILPDIHNPYYKLTVQQISSFRQEYDVEAKNQKKMRSSDISEESITSDGHQGKDQAGEKEVEKTGEDKCSKIQNRTRSSTDTLVLENYYENAEEVQKDLENQSKSDTPSKSLRDCITYSEPLTPMLQEVIDDFASDDEPQMQIVEDPEETPNIDSSIQKSDSANIIRESQSYNKKTESIATAKENDDEITKPSKIKSLKLKKTQKGIWENKDPLGNISSNFQNKETNNNESEELFNEKGAVNNTILTADSQLPNNQEGLANKSNSQRTSIESSNGDSQERRKKKKDKSVKRSRSQSSVEPKRKKMEKKCYETEGQEKDTQTFNSHPQATILQEELVNSAESIQIGQENCTNQNDKTDDTNIPPNVVMDNKTAVSNEGTSQEAGPSGIKTTLSPADVNPCLKSVSLYAEKHSHSKYSDSESEELDRTKKAREINHDHVTDKELLVTKEINSPVQSEDTAAEMVNMSISDNIKCKTMKDIEDVILLKSHSDSDSEYFEHRPKRMNGVGRVEKSRQNALANVFGFCSGAVSKRSVNRNKPTARRLLNRHRLNTRNISTNTQVGSSYGSDSDEAPMIADRRGSHGRHNRIYPTGYLCISPRTGNDLTDCQPQTYDIIRKPGVGLCAVIDKKIYPVMLKENGHLRYCETRETSGLDESDAYWKAKYMKERQKYEEEKIRADELARLVIKAKEAQQPREISSSPILQSNKTLNTTNLNQPKQVNEPTPAVVECKNTNEPNIKIKFGKNGEIEVEGSWPQVNPVLERMVEMYIKKSPKDNVEKITEENTTNIANSKPEVAPDPPKLKEINRNNEEVSSNSSDTDTRRAEREKSVEVITIEEPDKDVHETVDKIECEIFKEIEEIDKSDEKIKSNESVAKEIEEIDNTDENIKSNESVEKEIEIDKTNENIKSNESVEKEIEIDKTNKNIKSNESVGDVNVTKRRGRPKKIPLSLSATSTESVAKKRRTSFKQQTKMGVENDSASGTSKRTTRTRSPTKSASDSNIPPKVKPQRSESKLSLNSVPEVDVNDEDLIRYKFPPNVSTRVIKNIKKTSSYSIKPKQTSPNNSSRHSDPTQGYQDSDSSPPNVIKRKKKMTTLALINKKGQFKRIKRKSSPYLGDDDSNSTEAMTQKLVESSASINSEVYRSESYQLLLPKIKPVVNQLDKIDECPVQNETEATRKNFSLLTPLTINVNNELYIPKDQLGDDSRLRSSEGNSSNVSLPLSPELSVVENFTVSREMISIGLEDLPSINETHANNNGTRPTECNKYLISEVDVSMPLMNQTCELQTLLTPKARAKRSNSTPLLSPINTRNLKEQSHTDSLHQKLRDLLLESAKKVAAGNTDPPNQETMKIDTTEQSGKKTRAKKRCSTPRKKTIINSRSKTPNIESVLEERTESCSRGGRKSCPPIINIIPYEDPIPVNSNNYHETALTETSTGKRKKDIIKVKIVRPRSKSGPKERARSSRLSVFTDSGINDTKSTISDDCKCCNVSTDLIHNHSDTCLNMAECVSDSVEFIENTSKSIISVSSNSVQCEANIVESKTSNEEFVTLEIFCTNAQDATSLCEARQLSEQGTDGNGGSTVYHTPPSNGSFGSLITEDEDDKSQTPPSHSKWYLFEEDETNFTDARSQDAHTANFGSNLKQIFTNVFAVPNLSTITEMSKENESKPVINTDAETEITSPSIFEHDF